MNPVAVRIISVEILLCWMTIFLVLHVSNFPSRLLNDNDKDACRIPHLKNLIELFDEIESSKIRGKANFFLFL